VNKEDIKMKLDQNVVNSHEWYYEAKSGGWWLYEKRLSKEIEAAFKENNKSCRVQISGFTYVVDFENYVQFREDYPNRRRKIKRAQVIEKDMKGVAGIALDRHEERKKDSALS